MKIAILHSIYKPETRGGAEVVVENIVTGLKQRGHEVLVIAVGRSDEVLEINGVKVYKVKHFNLFNFFDLSQQPVWKRLLWHLIDMFNDVQTWKIYKILEAEKPELALTHSLKGLGYEVPWLLKILKIRYIHTIHDMQLLHPSGLLEDQVSLAWPVKAYLSCCRWLFGNPSVVVFPSEYIRSIYGRFRFFKKSECRILGNPLPQNTKIKMAKANLESTLTFAFVGQTEEYKGIIDLIKAVDSLGGDWQLLVAGEGGALREAKKLALDNKKVKFLGHLDQRELEQKIWSVTDLLINPSRVPESFGMGIIEAQSHGVPALVAQVGALSQVVKTGETGWFFKPKDQFDLRRQIEFILTNREKILLLKGGCLEAANQFLIDAYLNKLLK
jgi:glycosyltransferase involved in cell wall biosynthesis